MTYMFCDFVISIKGVFEVGMYSFPPLASLLPNQQ